MRVPLLNPRRTAAPSNAEQLLLLFLLLGLRLSLRRRLSLRLRLCLVRVVRLCLVG